MAAEAWYLKKFNELSNDELYNILRLRNSVFIVDQQCVFADIDGEDQLNCHHLFHSTQGQIIAYTRILAPGQIYQEPCLSRVCISPAQRGKGIGKQLLTNAIEETSKLFPERSIRIGAQLYLKSFYESFGFKVDGDIYFEDGIAHVQMIKKNSSHSQIHDSRFNY